MNANKKIEALVKKAQAANAVKRDKIIKKLIMYLDNKDLRYCACEALGKLGDRQAI